MAKKSKGRARRSVKKTVVAKLPKALPKGCSFAWVDKRGNVKCSPPHSRRHKALGVKITRKPKHFYYVKGRSVISFKPRNAR